MNDEDQYYFDILLEREAPSLPPQAVAGTVRPGAMDAEIGALPRTEVERLVEQAGIGLERAGRMIDQGKATELGRIFSVIDEWVPGTLNDITGKQIPIIGEMRLRDLIPFVGSTMDVTDPLTGKITREQFGTPQALQMLGRGESLTTGTGFATQMKPDVKAAAGELLVAPALKGAGTAATVARKSSRKSLAQSMRQAGMEGRKPVGTNKEVAE